MLLGSTVHLAASFEVTMTTVNTAFCTVIVRLLNGGGFGAFRVVRGRVGVTSGTTGGTPVRCGGQ